MKSPEHHSEATAHISAEALEILRRGLGELLAMTDGLAYRPLPSERYPLPLSRMAYARQVDAATVRDDVRSWMAADPVDPPFPLAAPCPASAPASSWFGVSLTTSKRLPSQA